jgi:hypothetical protein
MKTASEEMRIVFSLNAHVKTSQVLGDRTFGLLEADNPMDMMAVFHAIQGVLDQFEIRPKFQTYDGKPITEKRVEERIKRTGKWFTLIEIGGVSVAANNLTGRRQSFIILKEKFPGAVSSWDQWIAPFLGWPNFVQAWVADKDYDYWQNAIDPMLYTSAGRDMSGLKLKSNGQPYPSEREIVDTSENPGRWEFRKGYMEAIGSPMWIGENLWKAIGENRESELRALDWLHLTEPQNGILRLESNVPFNDETTASEQNALRAAIYGSGQQND